MDILVVGGGAIGCFLGSRLAASGQRVTIAEQPGPAAIIRASGVRLVEPDGRETAPEVEICDGIGGALADGRSYDLGLVAVKAYHTASVTAELQQFMRTPFPVLTVQNGVGNEETLAAAAPVLSGALTTPIEVLAPGHVKIARPSFRFGLASGPGGGEVDSLAQVFTAAGFKTQIFEDYRGLKWSKLLMNLLANAQSAILGHTPAQLFANRDLGNLEILAWREALAAMRAQGVKPVSFGGYPLPLAATIIERLPLAVVRPLLGRFISGGRGSKMPSLYYDLYPTRRTHSEVHWLNGAIVAAAEKTGVPVPVNATFTRILAGLVSGDEKTEDWQRQPERLIEAVQTTSAV